MKEHHNLHQTVLCIPSTAAETPSPFLRTKSQHDTHLSANRPDPYSIHQSHGKKQIYIGYVTITFLIKSKETLNSSLITSPSLIIRYQLITGNTSSYMYNPHIKFTTNSQHALYNRNQQQ